MWDRPARSWRPRFDSDGSRSAATPPRPRVQLREADRESARGGCPTDERCIVMIHRFGIKEHLARHYGMGVAEVSAPHQAGQWWQRDPAV
jgi:hypothetical protein